MSQIYDFFEPRVLLPDKTKSGKENYTYMCKLYKNLNLKDRSGEFVKVKQERGKKLNLMI